MQFYSTEEIVGRLPDSIVQAFVKSQAKYITLKNELDQLKNSGECPVEAFMTKARLANDAFLEWKGANKAVAQFLMKFKQA